MDQQDLLHSK